jgi:hypothetical protein
MFILCDGDGQPQKTNSGRGVTRNQHAAREYHRKEKQRRVKAKPKDQSTRAEPGPPRSQAESSVASTNVASVTTSDPEQQPSPCTMLGASRRDPFNSACETDVSLYVHEMLDHAVSYQWSEFRLSDDMAGLNAARAEIMQSVMQSKVAWYSVIFAGATHNAYQHGGRGVTKENEQLRLHYKSKALRALMDDIARSGDSVSEQTLLSMITMASHGSGETLRGTNNLKRQDAPFLCQPRHDVDYYAAMDTGLEHINALYAIVDKRGGLRSIKLRSLAICVQL